MRIVRFIVAGCLLCVTVAAQQSSPPRSASSGVYSSGQAEAGEKIYFATCANCHGADLGGVERAPALTGAAFLESWQGQDLCGCGRGSTRCRQTRPGASQIRTPLR
jgi:mono/diheme cytochrome c family protein